jgi:hypothetical protein
LVVFNRFTITLREPCCQIEVFHSIARRL